MLVIITWQDIKLRKAALAVATAAAAQVALGITILLLAVPVELGVLHQLIATILVLSFFNFVFRAFVVQ